MDHLSFVESAAILGGFGIGAYLLVVVTVLAYTQHLSNVQAERVTKLEKRRLITSVETVNTLYRRVVEADLTPWSGVVTFMEGLSTYPELVKKIRSRDTESDEYQILISAIRRRLDKLLETTPEGHLTREQIDLISKKYGVNV